MSTFSHLEFDNHEQVLFVQDEQSGLKAIVAVHNTNLGPSLGGCRMWPYKSDNEALTDVLRLSRSMTYKAAVAGLAQGGGKCVIIGDPRKDKSPELLRALGRYIEGLSGAYIIAEDSGTSVADIKTMGECTQYIAGVSDDSEHGGDPSPSTAYGVFVGIKAAVKYRHNQTTLNGIKVAIQGVGNVGFHLAKHLKEAGAELIVTDIFNANLTRVVTELGARVVAPEDIYSTDADVFAPCALGGSINAESLAKMKAKIIAGAANNQLARPETSLLLSANDILYAPDYVINAGGIIDIAYQRNGQGVAAMKNHLDAIGTTLTRIFERSTAQGLPTETIANRIAEERFKRQ